MTTVPTDPDHRPKPVGKPGQALDKRPEFLIAMYGQLMGNINRHIVVVWQMLGRSPGLDSRLGDSSKAGITLSLRIPFDRIRKRLGD